MRRGAWTLRNRLRTAIVVAGVSLGLALVVAVAAFSQLSRYQDEVTGDIFNAVVELEELQADLINAEAAVRAYALSGDEEFLASYTALAYGRPDRVRAGLVEILPRVPELDAHFDTLADATDDWRAGYAKPLIEATRSPEIDVDLGEWQEPGAELFGDVRSSLRDALDDLIDYRAEGAAAMAAWQRVLLGSVVALAVLGLVTGILLWSYLRRWVTDPLDELAEGSRAVAEGELDRPVAVSGPDEIVALAHDVDLMRRHLVAQIATTERARVELEASNRDLEQFAYVASHDLQEPLRKVASFTQLLERRYGDQLDERGHQYIAFASDGARRMQRLIQDLLAFSRLGRGDAEPTQVDVGDCLTDALDNLSEMIEETGAQVTCDPLPEVLGHAGLLTQLLQNLVANAVKFRRPDATPRVHVGVQRVGSEWLFRCSDNGIGIEPRHAERVFVIFQRLHAKDAYSGTGIGLAMCKRIVEHHGGRIWVEHQEPSEGTTVRWTVPLSVSRALPNLGPRAEVDGERAIMTPGAAGGPLTSEVDG
ncbi:multi-sensor signal transduction histidine kinase [Georgenia satyanarayanai]|uniref:histidine kinase n=1 Tax=Georgenia satyanarayanai TaxID=860221 RepID=A0A2Y9ACW6_9MICO|nr:ATP-binding protein [Georgenia satyanarayanai]PYF99843.1 multi-sensor signal transduction histidine kinase [Georgenia satyanarayanai]SSA41826.1 multi-sensor signal transduction histidine kinase [Georgenia satyanarayanai]